MSCELTTEQQFRLEAFKMQVSKMNEQEIKNGLVEMCRQSMIQDNHHREQVRKAWGISK